MYWQCAALNLEMHSPSSYCHVDTSFTTQEGPIVQGFADGNAAVMGHDSENLKF